MSAELLSVREILVAEDHPLLADALATLVRSRFSQAHVRTVHDFGDALAAVQDVAPDLFLIDADMPRTAPCAGVWHCWPLRPQCG